MHFMTKLLGGISDEAVHRVFVRYGRGDYEGPAVEIAVSGAGKVGVKSTYEFQGLVAACFLKVVPVETVRMQGSILSLEPLDDVVKKLGIAASPFLKKRAMLLFESKISGDYTRAQATSLYDQVGETAHILCGLGGAPGWSHKTKEQLPSPKKDASLEERLKFSSTQAPGGTTFLRELLALSAPDFQDSLPSSFSSLRLVTTYLIEELVFPPDREKLSSAELRQRTKRKGKLHRQLVVDGKEYLREHPFTA
jgi:hypothetical protein